MKYLCGLVIFTSTFTHAASRFTAGDPTSDTIIYYLGDLDEKVGFDWASYDFKHQIDAGLAKSGQPRPNYAFVSYGKPWMALAQAGRGTIAVDQIWQDLRDFEFNARLTIKRRILVGHEVGAFSALQLALAYPTAFTAVALSSVPIPDVGDPTETNRKNFGKNYRKGLKASHGIFKSLGALRVAWRTTFREPKRQRKIFGPKSWKAIDPLRRLRAMPGAPIINVLYGGDDKALRDWHESLRQIAAERPELGCEVTMISGAGRSSPTFEKLGVAFILKALARNAP